MLMHTSARREKNGVPGDAYPSCCSSWSSSGSSPTSRTSGPSASTWRRARRRSASTLGAAGSAANRIVEIRGVIDPATALG